MFQQIERPNASENDCDGNRSMMVLNVSHRLANANHEKISEKKAFILAKFHQSHHNNTEEITHNALYVEEEHPKEPMSRFIKSG